MPEIPSERWGWSVGPLEEGNSYQLDIYAAAGQCDKSKGYHVGFLDVAYYGDMVNVTFNNFDVYDLAETHLYVGTNTMPRTKRGKIITSPGQYPFQHSGLATGTTKDNFIVTGMKGDIYVVAHSVTCGGAGLAGTETIVTSEGTTCICKTQEPSSSPTAAPTESPYPSGTPTESPTKSPAPSASPTGTPSASPSAGPTATPTARPTARPTKSPTPVPTATPSAAPTGAPSAGPTATPTATPTASPSAFPSHAPTASPSSSPTQMLCECAEGYTSESAWVVSTPEFTDGGCETAFAYFGGVSGTGECFLNYNIKRWGWSIGPLSPGMSASYEIYAGAGQCDLLKGAYVGTLTVAYDGAFVDATYRMIGNYVMQQTHFYADIDPMPKDDRGKFTVAPGRYTDQHYLNDATIDSFSIGNYRNETIYVVAHAVTCGSSGSNFASSPQEMEGCVCQPTKTDAPTSSPTGAPTASPTKKPTASPTDAPTQKPTASPTMTPTKAPVMPRPSCDCDESMGFYEVSGVEATSAEITNGGCETAFAYDPDTKTCFDMVSGFNSPRWGWSLGPFDATVDKNFKIYAGAGGCNLSKGTLVGNLGFHYNGKVATVTYSMNSGYSMSETHFYIGEKPLPTDKKGSYTVAPGAYTRVHGDLGAAVTHTFEIDGFKSQSVYIVAHAVSCAGSTPRIDTGCVCEMKTEAPTSKPTAAPTVPPTQKPTAKPSPGPTAKPTSSPTKAPTPSPTIASTYCDCQMEGCYSVEELSWTTPLEATYTGCETAYASFYPSTLAGTCFTDYPELKPARWGWSIGPIQEGEYHFDIFSGAAQCDRNKGHYVGILSVTYRDGNITASYDTFDMYEMTETHIYVGDEPMPIDSRGAIKLCPAGSKQEDGGCVAHKEFARSSSSVYGPDDSPAFGPGLTGAKYIIAHSVTCDKSGARRHLTDIVDMNGCPCVCPPAPAPTPPVTRTKGKVTRHLEDETAEADGPVKCATAFGYHSDKLSNRLKDMGMSPMVYEGNDITWGWSNGPFTSSNFAYSMDLLAEFDGVGKSVGSMSVAYDGEEAVVTVEAGDRLWIKELHAYVGTEPLPKNADGTPIADPAEFPIIHKRMSLSRTFNVENFHGEPAYVVTHATVCGVFTEEDAKDEMKGKEQKSFFRRLLS